MLGFSWGLFFFWFFPFSLNIEGNDSGGAGVVMEGGQLGLVERGFGNASSRLQKQLSHWRAAVPKSS